MELKSKISTSIEQSKKLIELGVKPETADVTICTIEGDSHPVMMTWSESLTENGLENDRTASPSWSLSRLIELMPPNIPKKDGGIYSLAIYMGTPCAVYERPSEYGYEYKRKEYGYDLFDTLINMIDFLIKNNYFNKR